MTDSYLLPNRHDAAAVRFGALSEIFDKWTFDHLDAIGLGRGWRCWEVGVGGEATPRGLAARVGASGRVLATDIDVSKAAGVAGGVIEVLRHDVAADPPPGHNFDLVHARLVLVHVPDRERALANMVAALRPGGWLVIEDADPLLQPLACLDAQTDREALANRVRDGIRALLAERGADLKFGRKLPRLLRRVGLENIRAEGFLPLGGPAMARLEAETTAMLAEQLLVKGLVTRTDLEAHEKALGSGELVLTMGPLITAWGRKP